MKLKPVALSLSQSEIDEIATELLEAMQPDWQNAIDLTAAQVYAGYTAPDNGLFICSGVWTSGNQVTVTINGIKIARSGFTNGSDYNATYCNCVVNKGDVIKFSINAANKDTIAFVPFKTSNPVSLRPLDPHKIDTAILNHWDDITSDFSTTGSSAGVTLDYVKYNPVLRMLKYKITRNQSTGATTTEKHELIYNGSDMIAFSGSTILLESINFISTITSGYEVSSKIISSNQIEVNCYNRNGSNAWESGHYFTGVIYL